MSRASKTVRRRLEITNRLGLHARAATLLVQTLQRYRVEAAVTKEGQRVDGKSIIGLMMLAAVQGSVIEIEARGPDAEFAVEAVEALVKDNFNEGS